MKHQVLDPSQFRTFGDLLRYLRERMRLSQRELAARVGYHYSYLSRLEKNVRVPDELILRTRFIPALRLENEPALADRLLELAAAVSASPVEKTRAEERPSQRPRWEAKLPVSLTPLLGREAESAALFQILSSDEVRLATLIGPPGVGKTRLSLHIAEQLSPAFEDGAIFVDLMPILEAEQVIPALAAALGVQESIGNTVLESVESVLRQRDMLIVMDNFEQVLDAAPQLMPLLGAARGVKILATSREALRLRGEQEFPLAPLPVPDATNSSALEFPSVQLFVQRAHAAKPDLQLDDADILRVAEICRRLDGLPLAIELAAARIRSFSPADMLEQFDRRFQWLAVTGRDVPEWRRTLWSAIAWSYNLLSEKERILFERLAVFAGGWTIEAAEAVCSDEALCPRVEILNMLLQMVDKSLVVGESGQRFRLLDTIAKFAHEKLMERGELEETNNRHLRYFADWAKTLDSQFHAISPLVFQNRTSAELNNIRVALDWALSHRQVFADGARLAIPASLIFLEHGLIRDEYERAQMFLRETSDPLLKARLLLRTASLAIRLDQDELVYEYCRRAETIARDLNERKLLADALQMIGDMDRNRGRLDTAEPSLSECAQIYRELNLMHQLNQSLTALGINFFNQERLEQAAELLNEALEIAERIGDEAGQGYAHFVRASQLGYLGNHAESMAAFERAFVLSHASGNLNIAAHCLNCISIEANILEDYPTSEKYSREAIALLQSLGNLQQAYCWRMLAYAVLHQGFPSRAHGYALQSLKDNLNGGIGVMNCLTALAEIKLTQGNLEPVARLYGFLAPRVTEKYVNVNPDSLSFERIGRALADKGTEAWQAEGATMNLEQAIAIASRWTSSGSSRPKRRSTPKHISTKKRSRR